MNRLLPMASKAASQYPSYYPGWSFIKVILLCWLSALSLLQQTHAAVQYRTIVSLTFDDGRADQYTARSILSNHSMDGTFYINSDRIGASDFMTWAQVHDLYNDGNEIAGHTIGHVDLATLSDAQQRDAICNDMQSLINQGFPVYSFAYPYSSTGPNTQSIVAAGCPSGTYESARAIGGLVVPGGCSGCPWANTTPPANPYYIATNNSVTSTTSLDTIKGYVTQAENNGGGWVPIVFHHVCDGCSSLAVSPATLTAFLDWLQARQANYTYVKTVHQVMSGDLGAPPPPPSVGANLLSNPSLETATSNVPTCWQLAGYGTNTATWTRTSDAHSGSFGEKVQITSYSSGDRKMVVKLDTCAPSPLTSGGTYQISAWYKANVPTTVVLFYRNSSGTWQYWRDAIQLPAAATTWTQMTYYVTGWPAGAQALSFGISLNRIGILTTDDYSMALVQ